MMNPPSVLLDRSFLEAVADAENERHDDAVATYRALIDDFVARRCLIMARNDHLREMNRGDLFAAVEKLHIARQHRHAAEVVAERSKIDLDEAITLVLIHRCRIRSVMTFHQYSVALPERVSQNCFAGTTLAVEGA
jgi:predicted nucleic acid-binding protein